jgi:predicted ATPase
MVGGVIEFDDVKKRWYFRKENQRFSIGITAEGIRKTAILSYLLRNKYLNEDSIIFIDEPESNLHPEAISKLLDIITILAKHGIQFFIASHSYFVIKKLFLIAQEQQMSIPVLSYQNNEWVQSDLKDDLPDNPIVDESIRLYEEQLDLAGV